MKFAKSSLAFCVRLCFLQKFANRKVLLDRESCKKTCETCESLLTDLLSISSLYRLADPESERTHQLPRTSGDYRPETGKVNLNGESHPNDASNTLRSATFNASPVDKMLQMQQLLQQQVLSPQQLSNHIQAAIQLQQQQQQTKSNDKQSGSQQSTANGSLISNGSAATNADQMQLLEHNLLFQQLTSNLAPSPVRNNRKQQPQLDAQLLQQQQILQCLQKYSDQQQYHSSNLVPYLTDFIKQQQSLANNLNGSPTSNAAANGSINKGLADLLGKEFLLNRTNTPDQSAEGMPLEQQQLLLTALAMSQGSSLPNRSTNSNSISNCLSNNHSNPDEDSQQKKQQQAIKAEPEVDYKSALFSNGSCKWPLCDQPMPDYRSFLQHLSNEHQLDDRSTAQARIQLEMVQQLESNLSKEQKVLQAMVHHLQAQKEANPTKHNLFSQNLSSIQNNGLFRMNSKSGLSSPLASLKQSGQQGLNNGISASEEDDHQSFGGGGGHLSTGSPTTSPIGQPAANRHSYPNHSSSHHSPNSSVNNHFNSSASKTNSINSGLSGGNDLHAASPFSFNPLSSPNFSNSNSLPNSSLSNFSLLTSHQSNNSGNLNSVLNGQSSLTTTSSNCSLVNGLNGVSMCNGSNTQNSSTQNSLSGSQSNQADLSGLHSSFLAQQQQLSNSNNKAGPGRRRMSDKHNLSVLLDYPGQMMQGFNDSPKGRRIVERATSDINDDMNKNREYYSNTDVRPPYTYASLIRQVGL